MGQLERYGLYVLCIVIFLILGVALWGGDPVLPAPPSSSALEVARNQLQTPPPAAERDDVVERLRREFSSSSVRNPAHAPLDATLALEGVRDASVQPVNSDLGGLTPVPVVSAAREYEVKKDDVLESIAKRELGAAKHWRDIMTANPGLAPTKLRPGMKIKLPAIGGTNDRAPAAPAVALGKDVYVVQKNDVLEAIALEHLGKSSRWKEIVAVNPGLDPHRLRPGMQIRLPRGDAASDARNGKR